MISQREVSSSRLKTFCLTSMEMFFSSSERGIQSGVVFRFESPRFSVASLIHASSYPLPLNRIRLCSPTAFFSKVFSAAAKSSAFSRTSAYSDKTSATAAFSMILAQAMLFDEPTMRNSNLFPVKANGDVRFRSVVSRRNFGKAGTPNIISVFLTPPKDVSFSIASKTPVSSSPRKTETMAGGASFAPKRWSLPAVATEDLNRS